MTAATPNLKDAVVVTKHGILAARYDSQHEKDAQLYIRNGTWDSLDAQDMIYCPDKQVVVMSPPLRGNSSQEQLAGVFSDLLDMFSAEDIWSIRRYTPEYFKKHPAAKQKWGGICKRIYKTTVQSKTLVNVRGVLLEVTRKGGTAIPKVILTGYNETLKYFYADKRIAYPNMLLPIYKPKTTRGLFDERGINYSFHALENASPYFEGVQVIPWPAGLEPIPYCEMDIPLKPPPEGMVHGVKVSRYVTRAQLVVRGTAREDVVSSW